MGKKVYVLQFPCFAVATVETVNRELHADFTATSKRFAANTAVAKRGSYNSGGTATRTSLLGTP